MSSTPSFDELGLRPEILRAVAEAGYTTPTPIQAQAIPTILAGPRRHGRRPDGHRQDRRLCPADPAKAAAAGQREPVAGAASGTRPDPDADARAGDPGRGGDRDLRQIHRDCARRSSTAASTYDSSCPIVRGGIEILVATPGRLLDHIEQKSVNLGQVEIFVLDEADRMLDMGFIPDIKRIMALLPATAKRQNLLFSATFSNEIKKLADQLLNAPRLIEVARRNTTAETVSQSVYKVSAEQQAGAARAHRRPRAICGRCSASCAPSTARRASRASSKRTA